MQSLMCLPFHLKNRSQRAFSCFSTWTSVRWYASYIGHVETPDVWCALQTALSPSKLLFLSISIQKVSIDKNVFGAGLLLQNVAFQFWYFMLVFKACTSVFLYLSPQMVSTAWACLFADDSSCSPSYRQF